MIIYHVLASIDLFSGGPSKSVSELALQQAKLGHSVTIFTNTHSESYFNNSPYKDLKIVFTNKRQFKKQLNNYINRDNPDVLHGHGLWQLEVHFMASIARKMNIPYVISPRGMLEPWALNHKKWKKLIALALYQRYDLNNADCIHATSHQEAENIKKNGFTNFICEIPNPIVVTPNDNIRNNIVQKNIKQLAYIGRLHPIKNIESLLYAWAELKNIDNWKLLIIGGGNENYVQKLKNIANQLNLKNIEFTGFVVGAEKEALMQNIDLLILPSYSENFGMVVAEALQYQIPTIASKGTPWSDLVTYRCGWWIDNDIKTIAKTIEEAISLSDEERLEMGKRGRKLIELKYCIEIVAKQMINMYEKILKNKILL